MEQELLTALVRIVDLGGYSALTSQQRARLNELRAPKPDPAVMPEVVPLETIEEEHV